MTGALLAVLAIIAFVVHRYTQPERLTALLVDQLQTRYGIELSLPGPARIDLLPRVSAQFDQPVLLAKAGSHPAAAKPLLKAGRIELELPWSTLIGDEPVIDSIRVKQATIDIDAVQAWLATQSSSSGPTRVPAFSLVIEDATLMRADQVVASGLNANLHSDGELGAWIDQWASVAGASSPIPPLSGTMDAKKIQVGETALDGVKLTIDDDAPPAKPPSGS